MARYGRSFPSQHSYQSKLVPAVVAVPLVSTLVDNFPGTSFSAQWTDTTGCSVANNQAVLPVNASSYSINTASNYAFTNGTTDASFLLQMTTPSGGTGDGVYFQFQDESGSNTIVGWGWAEGVIESFWVTGGGSYTYSASVAIGESATVWLKISYSHATTAWTWQYSFDGANWTTLNPSGSTGEIPATNMSGQIGVYADDSEGTAYIAKVNIPMLGGFFSMF